MSHLTPFHHPFIALLPYTMKREKNLKQGLEEIITDIYPKHFNGFTLKIQQHPIGHQYLFHRRVSKEIRIVYICITIKIKAKKEDMAQTPSIPKGTRDYSPEVMVKLYIRHDQIRIQTLWLLAAGNSGNGKSFDPYGEIRRGRG